jgi:predicted DNA-binding ribbon-helix-helix protein
MTKRSITIAGHRTSISLEAPYWTALSEIARDEKTSLAALVANVDRRRQPGTSLSSAIRLFVLDRARSKTAAPA